MYPSHRILHYSDFHMDIDVKNQRNQDVFRLLQSKTLNEWAAHYKNSQNLMKSAHALGFYLMSQAIPVREL